MSPPNDVYVRYLNELEEIKSMPKIKVGKMSRRLGIGLTTKGQRILERRPYGPGQHGPNARRPKPSEYSRQLLEKQKLRFLYGLREKQFKGIFARARAMEGTTGDNLISLLERRLDNVVYRSGFATTRAQARQLVAHGHFTVDGRKTDVPSYRLRSGQVVGIREESRNATYFKDLVASGQLAIERGLEWLTVSADALTISVTANPSRESGEQAVDLQAIIEFYNR